MIRASTFAGRRVAVFGLGRSGNATCRSLADGGAEVAAWDDGEAARAETARLGFPVVDLRAADWSTFSALILSPGVPLTHPEPHWTVQKARAAGVEVIGDVEIFFRERDATAPDAPVICITGTNGKSTTTALIAHILKSAGLDVQMGGNIGVPILALEPSLSFAPSDAHPHPARVHVIEMSSFQVDLTPSLRPTIGVLLNITPDHLDRHGPADDAALSLRNYAAIKERLVAAAMIASVGIDDDICREILGRKIESGAAVAFSAKGTIAPGYSRSGDDLVCADRGGNAVRLGSTAGVATLRGTHNVQNALAAVSAVRELIALGRKPIAVDWLAALRSYPGLPHRMEEVGRLAKPGGHVLFINDSKATNADSTDKALASFDRDIFWILGGKPKEGGITTLAPYFPRVAKAYLIGKATDEFAATLEGHVAVERSGTLDAALAAAARDAAASTGNEPVVLLSPACASYDQFKSFEHRGDEFRRLVRAMPGIAPPGGAA